MVQRFSRLDLAVFAGIVLLGLARLPEPFTGDQALNMMMGRAIADGGAPYVDLWDLKHPGVFFFFAAGGSLFGFDELGIHTFELLWMLALAVAVRIAAERVLVTRVAISLAPAFTVGFSFAAVSGLQLTQTETLVGLPILVSLLCVAASVRQETRHPRTWLVASGLSAGAVFVLKGPYVVIAVTFWGLALVDVMRSRGIGAARALRTLAPPLLAGWLVPVGATVIYLASKDALGVAWWSFVDFPRDAMVEMTIDPQRLREAVSWFVRVFSAPLVLATIAAWMRLRRGWDLLAWALVAWIVVGLPLIWSQVIGWWSYHYMLLLVPTGLLATVGGEIVWTGAFASGSRRSRRAVAAATLVLVVVLAMPRVVPGPAALADVVSARPLPFDDRSARAYQVEHDQPYADGMQTTSFLRAPGSHPGPIYVFGSPIIYVLAGRSPAISPMATWFYPTAEIFDRMVEELIGAPPPYVLVTQGGLGSFTAHDPSLEDEVMSLRGWLDDRYRVLRTDVGGTWYERRDLSTG